MGRKLSRQPNEFGADSRDEPVAANSDGSDGSTGSARYAGSDGSAGCDG